MKAEDIEKMIRLINKLPTEEALEEAMILLNEIVSEKKKRAEFCNKNRKQKKGSTKTSGTSETTTHTTSEVKEKTEFDKAIDGFVEMRKKIKKPLTEQGLKLIKDKLEKMYPGKEYLQIKVLNNSISNSRQGVFPLKEEEEQKPKSKYNPFEDLSDLPLI